MSLSLLLKKTRLSGHGLARLWKRYQRTIFLGDGGELPTGSFVILTAENPFGIIRRVPKSGAATKWFLSGFTRHVPVLCLTACARDLRYQEPGFACKMDKRGAYFLAKKLRQNAFYRVSSGILYLEPGPPMRRFSVVRIGSFASRLLDGKCWCWKKCVTRDSTRVASCFGVIRLGTV